MTCPSAYNIRSSLGFDMGQPLVSASYLLVICTHMYSYSNPEVCLEGFGLALIFRFFASSSCWRSWGIQKTEIDQVQESHIVRVNEPTGHLEKSRWPTVSSSLVGGGTMGDPVSPVANLQLSERVYLLIGAISCGWRDCVIRVSVGKHTTWCYPLY